MEDINLSPVSVKAKGDYTPLVQAIANMVDSTNKGCCKISNALLGKYIARKERDVSLIEAQTQKDREDIITGAKTLDTEIMELCKSHEIKQFPLLVGKVNQLEDNMRLFKAVAETVKELEATPAEEISDEPLSQDFFNRWRKEAELIEDDELRMLWSHLLTEEVKKPKTISVRTLDVVKNLSREEAQLFQEMAKICIDNTLLLNKELAPIIGTLNSTVMLQDAGLLGEQSLVRNFKICGTVNKNPVVLFYWAISGYAFISKKEIKFNFYPLTKAGKELLAIADVSYKDEDVILIAESISVQNPQADSVLYKVERVIQNPDGTMSYNFSLAPVWEQNAQTKQ